MAGSCFFTVFSLRSFEVSVLMSLLGDQLFSFFSASHSFTIYYSSDLYLDADGSYLAREEKSDTRGRGRKTGRMKQQ